LAIALLTAVAYWPSMSGEFVNWDDHHNFVLNHDYRGLSPANLKWAWTTTLLGHYIPVTWMSLGLDFQLWGMNPRGYHFTNLVLHALNAVLLFFVARRLLNALPAAKASFIGAAGALLYSIHPLRVESVAWITERRDLLSLCFLLLATVAYLRHVRAGAWTRWYALTLGAFALAILSKGSAVTFPAALLVLNWYPLGRLSLRRADRESVTKVIRELAPMFLMAAAGALGSVVALGPVVQLDVGDKIAVSAFSLWFYLLKTAAPVGLSPLYPMPSVINPFDAVYVLAYVAVAAAAWLLWRFRKQSGLVAAVAMYFVLVLPFLGVHQNGFQIAADRYVYLAGIPLGLLSAAAIARLSEARRWPVAGCLIVILMALTWRQTHVWQSSEQVWSRVLERDSTSYIAHSNLGQDLAERGHSARAIEHFRKAIAFKPSYPSPHNNLAFELAQLGRLDEAVQSYREAIRLHPEYADAYANLGNALAMQGKFDEAVANYAAAVEFAPRRAGTHFNMALALYQAGRLRESRAQVEYTLMLDPSMSDALRLHDDVRRALAATRAP
jgi:tetratricopeptide (TPR) repeat protein